jgi:UDP-glucose:glycoprotein glucosyltransferase
MVADLTQHSGRELVQNALEYVRNSRLIRLSLLHNPQSSLTETANHYLDIIDAVLSSNDIKLLDKLLKNENAEALISGVKTGSDFGVEPAQKSSFGLQLHQLLAGRVLEFQPGQRGLIVNGRVIGNIPVFFIELYFRAYRFEYQDHLMTTRSLHRMM